MINRKKLEEKRKYFKENPQSRLKRVIHGKEPSVYSFGIITPENPMGKKLPKSINEQRRNELKRFLDDGIFRYIYVKGTYNNYENPFVILNINFNEIESIGYKYDQESFIFATNDEASGKVIFEYWEKSSPGKESKYEMLDLSDYVKTVDTADNFYTKRKSWKFNIPFSIFESIELKNKNDYSGLSKEQIEEINDINLDVVLCEDKNLKHYYLQRGKVNYVVKNKYNEEFIKRRENIKKAR